MKRPHVVQPVICLLFLVALDLFISHRTYYVPGLHMFVNYKIVVDDTCARDMTKTKYDKLPWNYGTTWFNFFSKSLLKARFAKPYQNGIDWIVFWHPCDIQDGYIINKKTKELYILDDDIIAYQGKVLTFIEKDQVPDLDYFFEESGIKEQYVSIANLKWLWSHGIYGDPKLYRAHLWHILVRLVY